jgi:riboflavin biosynthesis pyrimidine reductase
LDKNERVSKKSKIFEQGEIYIATKTNTPLKNGELDIKSVLKTLYEKGIHSVFVECGGTLAGAFLKENLVDEIYQFIAPKILNDNSGKSCFDGDDVTKISKAKLLKIYETKQIGEDLLVKSLV